MCIVCFAITAVVGIHAYSVSQMEEISSRYVTTVKPIYYPLETQTGRYQNISYSALVSEDIALWENQPEVKCVSYSQACGFSFYLWQMIYGRDDFSEDVIITDPEWMTSIYVEGIRNAEFYDAVEIVDGTYIPNDINPDQTIPVLISDYISAKTGIGVSDTITISHDARFSMPSNRFVVSGIFTSELEGDKKLIYIPYRVAEQYHEKNGIETASTHLDYRFDVKFVLEEPDAAESFILRAVSWFQDKGYILQADDYAYKKEMYPLRMMLQMNDIIGVAIIFIGVSVLLILTLHSARIKRSECTVFRLISLPSGVLIRINMVERCIILIPAALIGFLVGGILLYMTLGIGSSVLLYSVTMILALHILLLLLCLFLCIHMIRQPLMGEMADGK